MLSCGDGGSTGQEVVDQINTNISGISTNVSNISTNSTSIADHETRITTLENSNLGHRVDQNETDIAALDTRVTTNTSSISTNTSNISDHDTRIAAEETISTDHETRLSDAESQILQLQGTDPRASLRLTAETTFGVTNTWQKLLAFDEARANRGGFTADATNHRLINDTGKDISISLVSLGVNVKFPGNETMDVVVYINGTPYSNSDFTLRGFGDNKPQAIYWESDVPFNDGDILEVWVKSDSGPFDATILRTHFCVAALVQDLV